MARTYRFISADGHIETSCEHWTGRVEEKYRDMAPRHIRLPNGGDGFLVEGHAIYQGGMNLYPGKPPEEYSPIGLKWDEMPGTGSSQQRLQELDADGLDAENLGAVAAGSEDGALEAAGEEVVEGDGAEASGVGGCAGDDDAVGFEEGLEGVISDGHG